MHSPFPPATSDSCRGTLQKVYFFLLGSLRKIKQGSTTEPWCVKMYSVASCEACASFDNIIHRYEGEIYALYISKLFIFSTLIAQVAGTFSDTTVVPKTTRHLKLI